MVEALSDKIDAGYIQLYLIDSVSLESWYNSSIHPHDRVVRHNQWEAYLIHELLPFIRSQNWSSELITAGTSFGAYLAVNFALKHPELVSKTVGISGSYTIARMLDGYYDEDCYFNCPVAYMANLSDASRLDEIRSMEIALVTSDLDLGVCNEGTHHLSRILNEHRIGHRLDDWGGGVGHDWPFWRKMIREYL